MSDSEVQITFSNFNYSYSYFYQKYKDVCVTLIEAQNILTIRREISSFISEFSYGLSDEQLKVDFQNKLTDLKIEIDGDLALTELLQRDHLHPMNELIYLKLYYGYYLQYLHLLETFAQNLTSSLMPNTTIETKLVKFSNNHLFLEKLFELKRLVAEEISDFRINNFRKPINAILVLLHTYGMYITVSDRLFCEKMLEYSLNILLNDAVLEAISLYPKCIDSDKELLLQVEKEVYSTILECNSKINESFSQYAILPKITKKIYVDKTLI